MNPILMVDKKWMPLVWAFILFVAIPVGAAWILRCWWRDFLRDIRRRRAIR